MDFKFDMPKPHCPVVDVDGIIAKGKQFNLDITLADDNRIKYQLYYNFFEK